MSGLAVTLLGFSIRRARLCAHDPAGVGNGSILRSPDKRCNAPVGWAILLSFDAASENVTAGRGRRVARLDGSRFDVKCGALQALVHAAALAPPGSPLYDRARRRTPRTHAGFRPSAWSAWARTREIVSLSSTRSSSSSSCSGVNAPLVLRSVRIWSRRSPLGGSRRAATASIISMGAFMISLIRNSSPTTRQPTKNFVLTSHQQSFCAVGSPEPRSETAAAKSRGIAWLWQVRQECRADVA